MPLLLQSMETGRSGLHLAHAVRRAGVELRTGSGHAQTQHLYMAAETVRDQ